MLVSKNLTHKSLAQLSGVWQMMKQDNQIHDLELFLTEA